MRKTVSLIFIIFILFTFKGTCIARPCTQYIPQNKNPSTLELAFIREMRLAIFDAMTAHGDNQLFISTRIEKVVRDKKDDRFDVTLRTLSYEGPIMPPYKLIRITFQIPPLYSLSPGKSSAVIRYEHKYITTKKFLKLSEFTGY